MGSGKILFAVVILGVLFETEARIWGRRLREGEPCDTPGFFGDANDCRKFYRCAEHPTDDENNPHLIRYTFRCPNGTVFDEALTTCNHPEAVMDKPENCQVYDPDEGDDSDGSGQPMENKNRIPSSPSTSWASPKPFPFGGLFHNNQNQILIQQQQQQQPQWQQPLLFPTAYQILVPHGGNFIQYG